MAGNPFSNPEINSQIKVDILRLQAAALEWDDDPKGRGFDDHIVWTLVESLDAHAKAYLCKVESEDLVAPYVEYLHNVGAALIRNAEQRSFLSDPYSEDRLRHMAENSGEFAVQRHSLTPAQQEAAIRDDIERLRTANRPDAIEWHQWHSQMCSRIETRFEARYRWWEAKAIERAKVGKEGRLRGWVRRLQNELYESPCSPNTTAQVGRWPYAMLPVGPFTHTGGAKAPSTPQQPATLAQNDANAGFKAEKWEEIEISFLSDERVQITSGSGTETRNYGELGFMDKRGGGRPNQGWGLLRALARAGGTIPNSARNSRDFVAMGKRIERMRRTLTGHFGIPSDPVPLDPAKGYCCRFKIGCAPSFEK